MHDAQPDVYHQRGLNLIDCAVGGMQAGFRSALRAKERCPRRSARSSTAGKPRNGLLIVRASGGTCCLLALTQSLLSGKAAHSQ